MVRKGQVRKCCGHLSSRMEDQRRGGRTHLWFLARGMRGRYEAMNIGG